MIVDDSIYERNRSKKVELLTKVYDHAKHVYRSGFRLLTLGWSDGNSFLPVNSILLSSEKQKNRINEATCLDRRSVGHKRRMLSMTKGTQAMLELLKAAKTAMIPATHVLFDSWFSSPKSLHAVKQIGYDVIAMIKKTPKMLFLYKGEKPSLPEIYRRNRKRCGRSRYLLSVLIDVEKDGKTIPAKVVYVRNRNKRKEYLCLICTDVDLNEEEIIRIYGKRWDIEVFFKVCKSYLHLTKECQSLCLHAMTAHVAVVFTRYMMLSLENREANDERSLGELFLRLSDEQADITWVEAFHTMLTLFRKWVCEHVEANEIKLVELMDTFIKALPPLLQNLLQHAVIIFLLLPIPIWNSDKDIKQNLMMAISYIAGTIFSGISRKIGIQVATIANKKTAEAAQKGIRQSFLCGFRGGAVMGMYSQKQGIGVIKRFNKIIE